MIRVLCFTSIFFAACSGTTDSPGTHTTGTEAGPTAMPGTPLPDAGPPDPEPADETPAPPPFDRSKLASDVEPCIGRSGKYVRCVARVVTGNRPKSLAFSPDGRELWVALHYDKPAVAVYDTETFALVGGVELGAYGAVELHFSPSGDKVYFSQFETATVYEIDRASRKVTRTFETGSKESKVVEVSADGKTLWVANWKGNDVSEFDLTSGKLRRSIKTPGIPRGLYATGDNSLLYIAGYTPGRLYAYDRKNGTLTTLSEKGSSVRHIVADENRGRIYTSDLGDARVRVYDIELGSFQELAETDAKPNTIDLSPDGKVLFVSNRGINNPESYLNVGPQWSSILVFDAQTGRRLDAVVAGNQSTGLDVSADGRLLATSDFLDNRINIYELASTERMRRGKGGNANTYRRHLKKKGDWGKKTPKDPSFWDRLAAPAAAKQPEGDQGKQ